MPELVGRDLADPPVTHEGRAEAPAADTGEPDTAQRDPAGTAATVATVRRLLAVVARMAGRRDGRGDVEPANLEAPGPAPDPVDVDAEPDEVAIRWDVTTPSATLRFGMSRDGPGWTISDACPAAPVAMIALSLGDLAELAAGRLDGMDGFLSGRIRLSGDLALARTLLSAAGVDPPHDS